MAAPHAQQPGEVEPSLHGNAAASIVVAQYAGDYREAYLRLAGGGPETYYAQRYSTNDFAAKSAPREADLLVVPSRHDYLEGFSMTIYKGLTSRTPIVASDHPMFRGRLEDRRTAMVFEAGDASGMASTVAALMDSPALYEALSEASLPAWEALQIPVKWGDLVRSWAAPERPGDLARLLAHGVPVT